jgi:hypothetical protein
LIEQQEFPFIGYAKCLIDSDISYIPGKNNSVIAKDHKAQHYFVLFEEKMHEKVSAVLSKPGEEEYCVKKDFSTLVGLQ